MAIAWQICHIAMSAHSLHDIPTLAPKVEGGAYMEHRLPLS